MKYQLGLVTRDGYCGVEVVGEKTNITQHLKVSIGYDITSKVYKDRGYKRGVILKKLGKWQDRNQHGINSQ